MNKVFPLFLIGLATLLSSAWADETHPFVDQNNITDIHTQGHKIYFKTLNGEKSLDLSTGKWSYSVAPSNTSPDENYDINNPSPLSNLNTPKAGIPNGYPGMVYSEVEVVDDPVKPSWMLIRDSGGEQFSHESLADLKGQKAYRFTIRPFSLFLIRGHKAWFGGSQGIMSLDLKTTKMISYLTWPLFSVLKTFKSGEKDYYLSRGGLFLIDHGVVTKKNVDPPEEKIEYYDMVADENRLYLLSNGDLVVFNTANGNHDVLKLPVRFADHLIKCGDKIIGFGSNQRASDDYTWTTGGAFSFSIKNKTIKKLTDLPIDNFDLEKFEASSEVMGGQGEDIITLTHFKYDPQKDDFQVLWQKGYIRENDQNSANYKIFYNGAGFSYMWGPDGYDIKTDFRYVVNKEKIDDFLEHRKNQKSKDSFERQKIGKELSTIQVQYQTIAQDEGEADIVDFREPESIPSPTPIPKTNNWKKWFYH